MLWVVIPALNEAENLRDLIPRVVAAVKPLHQDSRVLVVDDGSSDETSHVVEDIAATCSTVELERLGRNFGKATALQRGFDRATACGAQFVVMMDADGQDDPAELSRLMARIEEGADLVTGARLQRHDRFVKRKTSKLYNRATSALAGVPGKDFNSGFKAMRAEVTRDARPCSTASCIDT